MARGSDHLVVAGLEPSMNVESWPSGRDEAAQDGISAVTTATYNDIAQIYYEKWQDRSAIREHLLRFSDMIRAYGLASLPVIDIGCGPGFDAAFFRRAGLWAIGVDLSLAMMNVGRPDFAGDYVLADMRRLPLAPKIGGLWVSASFLHLPKEEAPEVLRRFRQILVPGGLLYMSLKAGHGAEWTAESHGQARSRYFVYWQPDELDALLQSTDFRIAEGWSSTVDEQTTWLIRFARKASSGLDLPLLFT